ncbi:MAG: YesL family protein [Oscillibacter sp.]|nr:YesL family protein [Oscillibacter sp.]
MYEKIFHSDNPFWSGMGRLFDIVELNLLWLICSLPLFTVGPAAVALYSAMIALVRGKETYPHRDFFRAFRKDFRRNAAAGILLSAVCAFLWTDVRICRQSGTGVFTFLMVFFFILLLFWLFTALYALPLLALRDGGLKNALILAFTLSIRRFPLTVALLLITLAALWVCHLFPPLIVAAVGISVHTKVSMLLPILKPWLPDTDSAPE